MLHVSAQDWRCPDRRFFSFSQFTDLPLPSGLCKNRAAEHRKRTSAAGTEICQVSGLCFCKLQMSMKPPLHWVQQTKRLHLSLFVLLPNIKNKQKKKVIHFLYKPSFIFSHFWECWPRKAFPPSLPSPHKASKYAFMINYRWHSDLKNTFTK